MWHVVLISLLAGAPKAPQEGQVVSVVPSLTGASSLLPFFEKAGTRSVLARPQAWKSDAHPMLDVDVTDAEAVTRVGIDPTGPLTRAQIGDAVMSCVRLINVDAYRKGCDASLARRGDVFEKVEGGVSIYATRDPIGRVLSAYTVHGKDSCAVDGHGRSVESLFPTLAKSTLKSLSGTAWTLSQKTPGAVQVLVTPGPGRAGALGLNAKEFELTVDGRSKGAPFSQFAGAGPSPVGALRLPGLAVVRARVSKAQLPALVSEVVRAMPGGGNALQPVAQEIAAALSGNTALFLSHVKVSQGLRTKEARFFALKGVLLAEVSDAAALETALSKLDKSALQFPQGALTVSVEGGLLVVSNDADARAKALAAVANAAGKQTHGFEFDVDPKAVAAALQKVPLLEAVQAQEIAALVAISSELGPLLSASERVTGWLDSSGDAQHVGRLTWKLDPAKFAPDAGVSDGGVSQP